MKGCNNCRRLRAENKEFKKLFVLQRTRMKEADAYWHQYHPGQELVLPDLGKLLEWLMERIKDLET